MLVKLHPQARSTSELASMAVNNRREMLGRAESSDVEALLDGVKLSSVPFTYRYLGLTLRLAFTKRRFRRVETSYERFLTQGEDEVDDLLRVLEQSFRVLRTEIKRIEDGQEQMKRTALPCVRTQMGLYRSFLVWLSGFRNESQEQKREFTSQSRCCIPMLDCGIETTTGIKRLVAEFVGVPTGRLLHDLRNLENLLVQPRTQVMEGDPNRTSRPRIVAARHA